MKVYVIGIGLIGGSMALDIQALDKNAVIIGIDANDSHLEQAIELGIIHQKSELTGVIDADFVIVAVPVDIALGLLPKVLDLVTDETLVFEVGSTKSPICEAVLNHPKRRNFLATHPIAGTEFSGPTAAIRNLFVDKTNIICEVEKTTFKLQEKGLKLFKDLGMRIRYMEPKSHDKHIAYVSHLSHISSFMLGKTVIEKEKDEKDIFDMAGSGFESTVRLAKSSPSQFKELLESGNYEQIFSEMESTNRIKEILNGK